MEPTQTKSSSNESVNDLYTRVRSKYYKTFRHIAMQVRLADEVVKEVGCRPNNIIGQQTAAATTIIRAHKLVDAGKAKEAADRLIEISNKKDQATSVLSIKSYYLCAVDGKNIDATPNTNIIFKIMAQV